MSEMSFEESKERLEEIASLVEDADMPLDEALALFEEAVTVGLHACEMSEQDIKLEVQGEEADQVQTPSLEADGVIQEDETVQ